MRDQTGVNTCLGIHFPAGNTAGVGGDNGNGNVQKYGNNISDYMISDIDQGIVLGVNCNANTFNNGRIRNIIQGKGIQFAGGSHPDQACLENKFTGLICWNIGSLADGAAAVFTLGAYADLNRIDSFSTECNGTFIVISAQADNNVLIGTPNEAQNNAWVDNSGTNTLIDTQGVTT